MATRFYLPSSGAAAVSPAYDSGWEYTEIATRLKTVRTRINSSMTTVNYSTLRSGAVDICYRQYVSDPISAQTITAQTIKFQIRGLEANTKNDAMTAIAVRVVSNDGSTQRGVILAGRDTLELSTSLQNRQYSATSTQVVAQANDRIVIEIGVYANPWGSGNYNNSLSIGDNSSTDLGENDTETTANNPWVEFANTISFAVDNGMTARDLFAGVPTIDKPTVSHAQFDLVSKEITFGIPTIDKPVCDQAAVDNDLTAKDITSGIPSIDKPTCNQGELTYPLVFGEESPTEGTGILWTTWSDGLGGTPDIIGGDWGHIGLREGDEARSGVYDLGDNSYRLLDLSSNVYGSGAGNFDLHIRGSATSFDQDAATPPWEIYGGQVNKNWRYVQVRARKATNALSGKTISISAPIIEKPSLNNPTVFAIGTSVTTIDGRVSPYDAIEPGDIIELAAGTRVPLEIKNLSGTAENPIIIRNATDGIAEINTSSGWYGFWLRNLHHFKFVGNGYSGAMYGIKITRSLYNGIIFQNKTDNFEIAYVEINRVDDGIGLQGQTVATSTPDYDYDGDGNIDNDDIVTRANYLQENWHIHHLKLDFDITLNTQMGLYVGNSNYLEGDPLYNPLIKNCHIHDIYIRNTYHKAFQVGSVTEGFDVHDLDIADCVIGASVSNAVAISINPGCNGELYNCKVVDCEGYGIGWLGTGGKIYNNLLVRVGRSGTYFDHGLYVAYKDPYTHSQATYVYNNTIIDPVDVGIVVGSQLTGVKVVRNNIVASPGGNYREVAGGTVVSNNLDAATVAEVGFTNASIDDYTLTAGSDAVDGGYDVSSLGLVDDMDGNSRPQNGVYDIGCYERVL